MDHFSVNTYPYSLGNFKEWVLKNDYHCVYILENGEKAYIGESLDARRRASEHEKKYSKLGFQRMHIITSDLMEETPAKHFEKLLIKLMKFDGKFKVINRNKGTTTHYIRVNEFELHFDKLWDRLAEMGLVKVEDFKFIMNSNAYKYSPYTTLTNEQNKVITHIRNVLASDETEGYSSEYFRRPILINGSAGTGKTLVATSLFHYLRNHKKFGKKKIALAVANVQMRSVLQDVFTNTGEGLCKEDVISPIELTKQKYDIVICDEVHALRRDMNLWFYAKHFREGNMRLGLDNSHDELDWILKQSEYQILFYDEKQCVKHSDIRDDYVKARIHDCPERGYRPIELKKQMRVKGGRSYVDYIYKILAQKAKSKKIFANYDFKLFTSLDDMRSEIAAKEKEYELCRICGGYAWEWTSQKDKSAPDINIGNVEIFWNDNNKTNWVRRPDTKDEMGSMYTLRGIDMNYNGVVIGPDLYYDTQSNEIKVKKGSLFSKDVKNNATDEEIKKYVLNIYALLLTRAIEGTYVYICDDNLKKYFQKFIESAR